MKVILFSIYYCKLLATVLLGIHKTNNPLSPSWRWNNWQHKNHSQRIRLF